MQLQRPVIVLSLLLSSAVVSAQPAPLRTNYPAGVTAPLFIVPASAVNGGGTASGPIYFPDGSSSAPSMTFANDTDTGVYRETTNIMGLAAGGVGMVGVTASGLVVRSDGSLAFTNAASISNAADLFMVRDTANVLAQRNGTNAQAFKIANTYTDGTHYEDAYIGWSGNIFAVVTETTGGSPRAMYVGTQGAAQFSIRTNNADRWVVASNGHLTAGTDNTYDIGANGATRPRNEYIASGTYVGSVAVASGFGSGAAFATGSVASSFDLNVGTTAGTTGVVTLPTALHGWTCRVDDITTIADRTYVSANSTTSATFTTTIGWTNNDHLVGSCTPY